MPPGLGGSPWSWQHSYLLLLELAMSGACAVPKAFKQTCGMSTTRTIKCGGPRISPSLSSQMLMGSRWRKIFYPTLCFSEVHAAVSQGAGSNSPTNSPTLDQQFPRTQYHVFSLQEIWDNKRECKATQIKILCLTL